MKTILKPSQPVKPDLISLLATFTLFSYHTLFKRSSEAAKLVQVMQATNLQNTNQKIPTLRDTKPLPHGTQYTFTLPPGISLKEFVDRKIYFETYTNSTIDIFPPNNNNLIMNVYHMNFPDKLPFVFEPPSNMLAPLPLGKTMEGNDLIIDLSELPHILIGGLPGYGKTSLLRSFVLSLKLAGCHVFAIDRKQIDFPPLNPWINVAKTEDEALSLITYLLKENEHRQNLLAEAGVTKIQDYPNKLPYIVLIVDEAAAIETKTTYEGIDSLARLARATGISILLATQKPSAKLWGQTFSNTRDMMAGRISFYVADYMTSQMVLGKGNTSACRLPMVKGRALVSLGEREYTVQTLFLDDKEAKEQLALLNAPPMTDLIPTISIQKKKLGRPRKKKED